MPTLDAVVQPSLNADFLETHAEGQSWSAQRLLPEKVLQFGEGGFLRGFVDWMIHGMNQKGLFGGRVVVVQPIGQGQVEKLNEQSGAYTLLMRGIEDGEVIERQELITSISRGINPYTHFQDYLRCAHNPDLRFIVSNTTEAGIAFNGEDKLKDEPQASFPGKLTRFLLERYTAFQGDLSKGFVLLPCELIDRNGDRLKETVLQTAANWSLDPEFIRWVETANIFTNTLVDRIVTGYPKDTIEALWDESGYRDDLFDTSEVFHLWVIEGPDSLSSELPLAEAGFNVIIADSMKPYRDRKVGILNGAHTSTALAAYLAGFDYVGDCMDDPLIAGLMRHAIYDEVIPTLTLPRAELELFAEAVFERFSNPFIRHSLQSIALNSVSKYKARVLPSLERFVALRGQLPTRLTFALAALIVFYRGTTVVNGALIGHRNGHPYPVKDNLPILEKMAALWVAFDGSSAGVRKLTDEVLRQTEWWGKDLCEVPGLAIATVEFTSAILAHGIRAALTDLVQSEALHGAMAATSARA
jgi:tagaturonate reductase